MIRFCVFGLPLLFACSRPAPPPDYSPLHALLGRLEATNTEATGHGAFHKGDNALQADLWKRLQALAATPDVDRLLIAAVDRVYTKYHENYYNGILFHWPYLGSRRAITLCDRILAEFPQSPVREQALWLKGFALRAPSMGPWPEAERDYETYAEQVKWTVDLDGARAVYRKLAKEFPEGVYGQAAARLAEAEDLTIILPRGPKEKDPRSP